MKGRLNKKNFHLNVYSKKGHLMSKTFKSLAITEKERFPVFRYYRFANKRAKLYYKAMIFKPKWKRIVGLLGFVFLSFLIFIIFREDYALNKTVREVGLKLTQIEKLSSLEAMDYKFIFHRDHYGVYFFDAEDGKWKKYGEYKYCHDILGNADEYEFVFSEGRFRTYNLKGIKGSLPKYVILYFFPSKKLSRKKGIIFYDKEDWKIL